MRFCTRHSSKTFFRRFLLAILLLVLTSCRGKDTTASPEPRVFVSPAAEISSYETLTLLSEDDPTHAHWVDFFGGSVDIDGELLVSGAPLWGRPPGDGTGAAYVYRRSAEGDWQTEAYLIPSDRIGGIQFDQHFGETIALNEGMIAVGAPGAHDPQAGEPKSFCHSYSVPLAQP
jgi:hypothetical protein